MRTKKKKIFKVVVVLFSGIILFAAAFIIYRIVVSTKMSEETVKREKDNLVVNSGVAQTFGEYDEKGDLIMSYEYDSEFQGYRVMKGSFQGFWFQ